MKRITLLIALLTGLGFFNRMSAGSDSGPVAVYVNVNNGGNVTLKVNNNGESTNSLCTWNVGLSQLNGYNFGNVSSLILDGGVAVGWAWDGNGFLADSWGVEYRVYKQGTSAPAWNSLPFDFQAADHSVNQDNSWNYNDQMWDANGKNINLLALATGGSGTYNVEIRYWRKDYWNSFYDSYLNNNFGTQTATFTITNHAPFIVTGTNVFNTAFSGLTIGLTETAYDFSAVYPSESSYLWEIIDIDGNPVSVANNTANTFSHTFADAGIYTVKLSVNGSSSENTTQTFRIIQKSDDGNKIFGGEMNYEQAWITKAIGNVLPNMTWSAAGTNPLGSTTSLSITDLPAQPGERFAIYQPVYLTAGTTYYYDMFMKTHSFDQMILQVYINDGSLLPIDVADHWDNSPENNEQFAFGVVNGYGDYKWKDDPQSLSDLFSFITYKGAGADKKCAFTAPSDGIYFVIIRGASWVSAGFDFSLSEIELAKGETLTWQGTSEDWNDTNNWSPQRIPNQYTTAIIPGGKAYYPTLDAVKFVRNIYFEQGGQIGRIDLLEAKRAYVQLNYGAQEMTNRWYMLSMPMQGIVSGDIAFGGKPSVFLRKFDAVNGTVSDGSNFIKGAWTNYYNSNKIGFEPGEGFIVWVNKGTAGDNLSKLGGVLELPCFEKVNAAGYNVANPYHYFDQEERPGKYFGHTDFEYFTVSGGVPQATGIFERGQERGRYSHRLNSEDITYAQPFPKEWL
ncbi:MAG: PKD domain-containing protein [Dysgonamonadaceae bacterium]|jgi:hypothetical protein|nr:PKD domain-containing protein [Dysgonamonadaceae bacterium]